MDISKVRSDGGVDERDAKKSNGDRIFELQAELELSDEELGMKAIQFIFDPDEEAGKADAFVDFLERSFDEDD